MSTQDKNTKGATDWSDDPRLTAYALDELEPAECAALEAAIAGDAAAQAHIKELRAFAASLELQLATEPRPELTRAQRDAIEARLSGSRLGDANAGASNAKPNVYPIAIKRKSMGKREYVAIAATLVIGGVGAWAIVNKMGTPAPNFRLFSGADSAPAKSAVADIKQRRQGSETTRLRGLGYLGGDGSESSSVRELAAVQGDPNEAPGLNPGLQEWKNEKLARLGERVRSLGYSEAPGEEAFGGESGDEYRSRYEPAPDAGNREAYARIYENVFLRPQNAPLSTFSIDVDTASYANVRRMIESGTLPPADAVRIEEFVNYFPYNYAGPEGEHPFSVNVEVGSAPWTPQHRLVRIGLKGKETLPAERRASNLVFLMDVSGSMNDELKLPLLKQALHMLVQELDGRDKVSIVVYAGASGLALPATSCDHSVNVHMALENLSAGGSTNGGAGIELAYKVARENYIDGGINRVILATDGDFNVGVSDDGSLVRLIEAKAKTGVFLSVLGFGRGNLQDAKMEQLADKGNGNYAYIDSVMEARKVLVEQMGSTLETIAKDVKIQVEFNPAEVQAYRLIGYENRVMAAEDFNDDKKDAGEIGAGHHVTALYEIVPVGVAFETADVDELRYSAPTTPSGAAFSGELFHLKLRYKRPDGDTSILLDTPVKDSGAHFQELSADTRFAAAVASFGMILRGSSYKGQATLSDVSRWAVESIGDDPGGYRAQFIGLVGKAQSLQPR